MELDFLQVRYCCSIFGNRHKCLISIADLTLVDGDLKLARNDPNHSLYEVKLKNCRTNIKFFRFGMVWI